MATRSLLYASSMASQLKVQTYKDVKHHAQVQKISWNLSQIFSAKEKPQQLWSDRFWYLSQPVERYWVPRVCNPISMMEPVRNPHDWRSKNCKMSAIAYIHAISVTFAFGINPHKNLTAWTYASTSCGQQARHHSSLLVSFFTACIDEGYSVKTPSNVLTSTMKLPSGFLWPSCSSRKKGCCKTGWQEICYSIMKLLKPHLNKLPSSFPY